MATIQALIDTENNDLFVSKRTTNRAPLKFPTQEGTYSFFQRNTLPRDYANEMAGGAQFCLLVLNQLEYGTSPFRSRDETVREKSRYKPATAHAASCVHILPS